MRRTHDCEPNGKHVAEYHLKQLSLSVSRPDEIRAISHELTLQSHTQRTNVKKRSFWEKKEKKVSGRKERICGSATSHFSRSDRPWVKYRKYKRIAGSTSLRIFDVSWKVPSTSHQVHVNLIVPHVRPFHSSPRTRSRWFARSLEDYFERTESARKAD